MCKDRKRNRRHNHCPTNVIILCYTFKIQWFNKHLKLTLSQVLHWVLRLRHAPCFPRSHQISIWFSSAYMNFCKVRLNETIDQRKWDPWKWGLAVVMMFLSIGIIMRTQTCASTSHGTSTHVNCQLTCPSAALYSEALEDLVYVYSPWLSRT